MPWDDICNIFEGVYVNWDPTLFRNCLQFHGCVVSVFWRYRNATNSTEEFGMERALRRTIVVSAFIPDTYI